MSTQITQTPGTRGLKLRLSKRLTTSRKRGEHYTYYITIPVRLVELLGLREGDEFTVTLDADKDKLRLIFELARR